MIIQFAKPKTKLKAGDYIRDTRFKPPLIGRVLHVSEVEGDKYPYMIFYAHGFCYSWGSEIMLITPTSSEIEEFNEAVFRWLENEAEYKNYVRRENEAIEKCRGEMSGPDDVDFEL
jgi:hypothetical protein